MQYILLCALLSPCLCQMEMKPDMTFGENNDRFDMSAMMANQNAMNLDNDREMEDYEEYRRSANARDDQLAADLREKVRRNKDFSTFAYHDTMDSGIGGDVEDFERGMKDIKIGKKFQGLVQFLQGKNRRSAGGVGQERDVLFNHAVPVHMTINGYLQEPQLE